MTEITDLIARLEELEKAATPGPWTETGDPHLCCDCPGSLDTGANVAIVLELRNNLPAIIHALKVQQAAEDLTGLLTERPNLLCPVCGMRPDMHDDWCAWGELVRVVKGEQP